MRLLLLLPLLLCGCAYDGMTINAEYGHNYFRDNVKNIRQDVGYTHAVVGPVFDLFGQDNVELRMSIGPEFREVNAEMDSAVLINPRLMWFFAEDSFLQLEYDGSFIPEEDQQNHFFFAQWEYRFGR